MAQYYHLVGQSEQTLQTVTLEELRQCYPNITCIESTNGVQYVINQEDAGTQFQSQQMLLTDQQIVLNAGEAHSQQIIVDQSQISFAQPQYINTDGEIVNEYQPDDLNSTQQVFYTTAVAGDMNNAKQRLLQTQLINQQQQIASQQIAVAQQAVAQPCIEQTQQVRSVVQQESDENELVKLSDGRIMTLGQYNQEVRKNQENQNVAQSPIAGQEMQEAKTYKQPTPKRNYKRQPQTPNNRGRGVNRGGRGGQSIRGRRPSEPGQIGLAVSPLTTAIHTTTKPPLQYSPHKNINKPAMQQNVMQQLHMQQPNAHNNMQQQNIIGANMQGYTPGRPQPPIPLSPQVHNGHAMQNISYSPTNQLQQLLDDSSSSVSDEYKDSAKMLVCLENGEQRLITFTIPKESCTVQDLLEQVGVPFNADTNIECMNNTGGDIDYIVSVGAVNNITAVVDEQQTGAMIPAAETNQPKPPEKAPEPPKEVPKFVPGYLAVCGHCGYVSEDFNRCQRCRTKLPDDPKTITTKNESSPAADNKKTELARLQNKALQKPNAKFNNSKTVPKTTVRRLKSKTADLESVILTLSSDDEDTSRSNMSSNASKMFNSERLAVIDKEPNISEYGSDIDDEEVLEGISGGGKDGTGSLTSPFHSTTIVCRTVRIGSFKFVPKENVIISSTAIKIVAPAIMNPSETISLYIPLQYILRVLVNYNKSLPILFFYVTPSIAGIVRKKLGMVDGSDLYFDPLSKQEPFKRITVIPEIISDENKSIMKEIFTSSPYKLLDELTPKEANNILIRTCPKDVTAPKVAPSTNNSFSEVRQLLIYPPGKGGIAINAEDYLCLAQDQFLNDVIIDFYLKYVMTEVIAADIQNKVHIFSSFFYKRLTTKPAKATKKLNPFEVDPTLTAAQKRHLRVKNWTKNVNIFEKDFIIIPINENSHWFLAIICFPSLEGCRSMEDANKIIKLPPKVKKIKEKPQCSITIGNTTITVRTDTTAIPIEKPIKCEDEELSDRDEADGDDSELEESETEEDEDSLPKKPKTREPIKQPCILIFDSLTGASRSRVVATLRDYLTCEHRVKLNSTKSFTKDNIKGACPKVPQQMNFTDCGLYVLQYVEAFFKNPITDYHIPIKQLKNWFEELTVTRKREDISILIKNLMTENNRDSSNVPEITFPTLNGKLTTAAEEHPPSEEEEEETEQGLEPGEIPSKELSKSLVSDVYNSESSDESPKQDEAASTQTSSSAVVVSTMASSIVVTELNSALKPDLSDVSKKSNRETMSYLKSKRILRHKNNDISEVKKQKID